MKIGILTYHRSHNYGALLQAIALREVLMREGHQVTFIDYWPAYHRHMYALFSFHRMMSRKGFKGKLDYLRSCIKNYTYRKERKNKYECFIAEYIEPYTSSVDEAYDVIVHGSDQIWRKQPELGTYNPVYFGKHNIKASKKISYAASMGILAKSNAEKSLLKNYIQCLDAVSVRESGLKDLIKDFGRNDVRQDLDPTLLLPADFWINKFKLKVRTEEHYALYYKIQDAFDIKELKTFAKSKGLKLKVIHSKALGKNTDENVTTAGPKAFLELMYGADMVFTSSFHGLAFSLIFHKPFLASFVKNAGRAASILQSLGMEDCLVNPKSKLVNVDANIDCSQIDNTLLPMRNDSIEFLKID